MHFFKSTKKVTYFNSDPKVKPSLVSLETAKNKLKCGFVSLLILQKAAQFGRNQGLFQTELKLLQKYKVSQSGSVSFKHVSKHQ